MISIKQFAHAVCLVQGVELFLGHLFELLDELDNAVVLILAHVIGVECDLFELFDGVDLVFPLWAPYRVAHGVGHVGMLIPITLVLESYTTIEPVIATW